MRVALQLCFRLCEILRPELDAGVDCALILGECRVGPPKTNLALVVYEPSVSEETVIGQLEYREDFASAICNGKLLPSQSRYSLFFIPSQHFFMPQWRAYTHIFPYTRSLTESISVDLSSPS